MSTSVTKSFLKGGEFLIREVSYDEVFIPEDFTEEQRMMAEATTDFIEKEVAPYREKFENKDYAFTAEVMKKAGELGLLGISVPEEYGGLGMDFNTSMLVCDRISGISGSLSTAFGAHTGIGTLPILLYGNDGQKEKYIPGLASGSLIGAYCLTEPGAGSDATRGNTKAELSADGESYKINGQKIWISNAGFADIFTVFARIGDDKYLTAFIVEKGNPGMTFGDEENKLGIRASSTRQVFFNDCLVSKDHLLGDRNGGFKIAMNALNYGRIKLSVACLDACRRVTSHAVSYANERKQFGSAISSFGAIQQKLAEMVTRTWVAESATYRAGQDVGNNIARLLASGMDQGEAKLQGVEEYAIECAILKVLGSEVGTFVTDEGLQIFGGMGYSADAPLEAAYRDMRIARIYEGTNEINRLHSVAMLLKKALKGELDLMTPAMAVASELMEIPSFGTDESDELFAAEKIAIAKLKKAVLMVAGKAVEVYGMNLEQEQELIMNAADMIIETYAAESGLLRAEKLAKAKGEEACKIEIDMARLYLHGTMEKVAAEGREALYSFVEGDEQRMMLIGLKRFTKPAEPINVKAIRRNIAERVIADNKYPF
jgi:alkylation response protein AidB-like acyl-CoA dehydrogenase